MPSIVTPDEPLDRCCPLLCLYFITEVVSLSGCENARHSSSAPRMLLVLGNLHHTHPLKTALFLCGKLASEANGWSGGRMEVLVFVGSLSPGGKLLHRMQG